MLVPSFVATTAGFIITPFVNCEGDVMRSILHPLQFTLTLGPGVLSDIHHDRPDYRILLTRPIRVDLHLLGVTGVVGVAWLTDYDYINRL